MLVKSLEPIIHACGRLGITLCLRSRLLRYLPQKLWNPRSPVKTPCSSGVPIAELRLEIDTSHTCQWEPGIKIVRGLDVVALALFASQIDPETPVGRMVPRRRPFESRRE